MIPLRTLRDRTHHPEPPARSTGGTGRGGTNRISPDGPESHARFRDKYRLPFPLLCDTDHKVAEKYGAWGEKNMYGKKRFGIKRTTFLLDEKGRILHIWKRPDVKRHAEQILEKLDELKTAK